MNYKKTIFAACLAFSASQAVLADTSSKYEAISHQLVLKANAALTSGDLDTAQLIFERALVADPASVEALIGLGETHEQKGSVGKGLKYYRYALEVEPNDKVALERQALAFLKRDLVDRAKDNQDKLVRLCPTGCDALTAVETAMNSYIDKPKSAASVASSEKTPNSR